MYGFGYGFWPGKLWARETCEMRIMREICLWDCAANARQAQHHYTTCHYLIKWTSKWKQVMNVKTFNGHICCWNLQIFRGFSMDIFVHETSNNLHQLQWKVWMICLTNKCLRVHFSHNKWSWDLLLSVLCKLENKFCQLKNTQPFLLLPNHLYPPPLPSSPLADAATHDEQYYLSILPQCNISV